MTGRRGPAPASIRELRKAARRLRDVTTEVVGHVYDGVVGPDLLAEPIESIEADLAVLRALLEPHETGDEDPASP